MGKIVSRFFSFLLSVPVIFYRYAISPYLRPACRHVPSCSQFMLDALKIHGPFTGLIMGTGRILRCRPGGTHGYDPVPLYRFRRYKPLASIFSGYSKENRLKH
jgi:putative membrane protein insertion efficiency factor